MHSPNVPDAGPVGTVHLPLQRHRLGRARSARSSHRDGAYVLALGQASGRDVYAAVERSVALVQLDATDDVERNLSAAVALADEVAADGARLVALPEYLPYRGPDDGYRASARPIPGPHTEPFAEVARRRGAWILVGSTAETSTLIAPDGSIAATYRKIHLFDVAVDSGPVDTESARVMPGDRVVIAAVDGPPWACRSATTSASPSCTTPSRWPAPRS